MSKTQVIEEILRCSPDARTYEGEQLLMKGLNGATIIALEFIQQQLKATITQQNKQNKQKQTNKNEMKRNVCNNGSSFFQTHANANIEFILYHGTTCQVKSRSNQNDLTAHMLLCHFVCL